MTLHGMRLAPLRLARGGRAAPTMRGLSLVELMVGVTVGLFVVAAAAVLVAGQLGENRRLLLETQLQQDLRAAADIVSRELRRVGAREDPARGIAFPEAAALNNPFNPVTLATTDPADVNFSYYRRFGEQGPWRFVLQGGVIRTQPGVGLPLQDLTDGTVMNVTRFAVDVTASTSIRVPCAKLCPGGGVDCWPEVRVREFDILIEAEARSDASVRRTLRSRVRPRNDWVNFNIAGPPPRACPA